MGSWQLDPRPPALTGPGGSHRLPWAEGQLPPQVTMEGTANPELTLTPIFLASDSSNMSLCLGADSLVPGDLPAPRRSYLRRRREAGSRPWYMADLGFVPKLSSAVTPPMPHDCF